MGKKSRDKGKREELDAVNDAKEAGIFARRVPLSGAVEGFEGDVEMLVADAYTLKGECKIRADGFKELYRWLSGNDFLTVRADRKERLAVMPYETFLELLYTAKQFHESKEGPILTEVSA